MNIKSILKWIETNKSLIKARPGKTVGYSGRDYDLDLEALVKDSTQEDKQVFKGTSFYKILQKSRTKVDLKLPADFQTLEIVLKSIRHHPKCITREHKELGPFSNAYDFFEKMEKDFSKLLPGSAVSLWEKRLSEIYMSNARDDIRILDGASDEYEKLGKDKILINTELMSLLKIADRLSLDGKKELLRVISKYKAELEGFDRRFKEMRLHLVKDVKLLTRR